ncbi:MAG: hypothetical protein ACTSVZ_13200 [Promethearchaeota archaeon]
MAILAIDWGIVLPNIFGSVFLAILIVIFIFHSVNQKRPVVYFLATLILAFLSTLLVALAWIIFEDGSFGMQLMRSIYLTISGLQLLMMFVFLENSRNVKISARRLVTCIGLFMLQCFGLWSLVGFYTQISLYDPFYMTFWMIAKLGFNLLALFVYGVSGIHIFYSMYNYTKERKSLFALISVIILTIGYGLSLVIDILDAVQDLAGIWSILKIIADTFPILGLFVVVLVYVSDITFIYRLPFNHYFLMVSYKSGVPIFSIPFQTKGKSMEVQENMFSAMMSALNTVYTTILFSQEPIEEIQSKGISLFSENGKYISAIVASDQVSRVLYRGMRQFVIEFEKKFESELSSSDNYMDHFQEGKAIFQRIFPFLIHKEK